MPTLPKALREYIEWRSDGDAAAADAADQLHPLSLSGWPDYLASHPELLTIPVLQGVLDTAKRALDSDVDSAVAITHFVVENLSRVASAPPPIDLVFRGRAWKEHANALRLRGAHGDRRHAEQAIRRAKRILKVHAAGLSELGNVYLVDAHLKLTGSNASAASRLVRTAIELFAATGDDQGLLYAEVTKAWIRFEVRDYVRANAIFRHALLIAKSLEDQITTARVMANIGQCAAKLDRDEEALEWFAVASLRYEVLGMRAERKRIALGIAEMARKHGLLEEALSAIETVRAQFLDCGMRIEAALASLEATEILLRVGRSDLVSARCRELMATFRDAKMPEKLARAVRLLQRDVKKGSLDDDRLDRHVQEISSLLAAA